MIKKYTFGTPFETGAVIEDIAMEECVLPYFISSEKDGIMTFELPLQKGDCVYGLGEQIRGINKRGWKYLSYNEDNPDINEGRNSLYGAHNFLVISGENQSFGMFFDCAGKVWFDIGYTDIDKMTISLSDGVNIYIIDGDDISDIVRQFRKIIGRSYIPPKWAFGFGQSRWGYVCKEDISEVVDGYKEADMPLDSVYLDIDYMDNYKDFTVNDERFPDFKNFVGEMKERGIHLVPIVDAAVKAEKGYPVFDEGVEKGYFCKDKDGQPYVLGVWPGDSVLPDVLNDEAANWFGENYKVLLDDGIDGFWNDMNEPAIFYSKGRLNAALEKIADKKGKNLPINEFWDLTGSLASLANNQEDYKEFYHETDCGRVPHYKLHNLYGYKLTESAADYFDRYDENKRFLLFSRSSYIGMHRYGGIWTGDNSSMWSHILLNLKMLPSLNMCGFLYVGADLGGFGGDTTEDLLLRWLALGIFTPLMRNHSALNTRKQEYFRFKDKSAFKNLLNFRYRLIPYLYSEFVRCAYSGDMLFKPLSFVYTDDERAKSVEDQLLVGDSLMIAPVHEQNADGRYVYLPQRMKLIRLCQDGSLKTKIMEKGAYFIKVELNEVVFFLLEGHVLPLAKPAKNVASLDETNLKWIKFIDKPTSFELCKDDGYTKKDIEKYIEKVTVLPD